jgi:poly(A) polymerase
MFALDDGPLRRVLCILSDLAPDAYVVGGAVRDVLSGVAGYVDLDVTLPGDGCEVGRSVADIMGSSCSFVPLDRDRGTARLVLKSQCSLAVDISTFKAPTIEQDLCKRDFTINAIAVSAADFLKGGTPALVDPCNGTADLRSRTVRVCSETSFSDDPLRVLRAFRFAAALSFDIAPHTLRLMPPSLQGLVSVAGERIRDELFAILATPSSFPVVRHMDEVGIVGALFPELAPMRGCAQNEYHHLDVWGHSLETIRTMEELLRGETVCLGDFQTLAETYASGEPIAGRPRSGLLKLAALFHDAGKPPTRFVDESGKVRFFGHEKVSVPVFETVASRLRLSSNEIQVVTGWIHGHMKPMALFNQPVTRRMVYRLWKAFGKEIAGLFVLFLADLAATRGPARKAHSDEEACQGVRTAWSIAQELQQTPPEPLVNGRDLMAELGLSPGPKLGRILGLLAEMQASGEITTREEAIAAARRFE